MVCRLIDFAYVVLELLIAKICGFVDISKIGFFNFSGNGSVKQYKKNSKTIKKLLTL